MATKLQGGEAAPLPQVPFPIWSENPVKVEEEEEERIQKQPMPEPPSEKVEMLLSYSESSESSSDDEPDWCSIFAAHSGKPEEDTNVNKVSSTSTTPSLFANLDKGEKITRRAERRIERLARIEKNMDKRRPHLLSYLLGEGEGKDGEEETTIENPEKKPRLSLLSEPLLERKGVTLEKMPLTESPFENPETEIPVKVVKVKVKVVKKAERLTEKPVEKPLLSKPKPVEEKNPEAVKQYILRMNWLTKMDRERELRPNFSDWEYDACYITLPERDFEREPAERLTPEQKALKEYLDAVRATRGYGLTTQPPYWALQYVDEHPHHKNVIPCPLDIGEQDPDHVKRMEDQVVAKIPGVVTSCKLLNLVGFSWGFTGRLAKYAIHLHREDEDEDKEEVAEAVFSFLCLVELKIVGGQTLLSTPLE